VSLPHFNQGIDWDEAGRIVASPAELGTGLTLFGADGSSRRLTELDEGASEWEHTWPQFLPDGKHVLFTVWTWKRGGAHVVSLETGERRRVVRHAMGARLIAPDLLVFRDSHRSDLMAARFDLDELRVVGEPVPLPDPVYQTARAGGAGSFCVSAAGTMIYEPAATGQRTHSPGWIAADARSSASAHRAPTRLPRSRRTDDGWHSSGTTSVRYRGGTRPVREATSGSTISSAARATDSLIEPTTSAQPGCPMASTSPSPRTATVCGTRM
jgi:hypothetical protein